MKAKELKEEVVRLLQARLEPLLPKMDGLTYEFVVTPILKSAGNWSKIGIIQIARMEMGGESWPIGIQDDRFRINNKFYGTVEEMVKDIPRIIKAKLDRSSSPLDLGKIQDERDALWKELIEKGRAKDVEKINNEYYVGALRLIGTNVWVHFRQINLNGRNRLDEARCLRFSTGTHRWVCDDQYNDICARPSSFPLQLKKVLQILSENGELNGELKEIKE